MHLSYDAATDVAYLRLREPRTDELLGPTLLLENDRDFPGAMALDFSAEDGTVLGLEFQVASRCLPQMLLATAERRDGQNLADRFDERVARRFDPVAVERSRRGRHQPGTN